MDNKPVFNVNKKFENLPKRKKAAIFRKAAAIIDGQPHLAKNNYKDEYGCACMVGALAEAADGTPLPVWKYEAEKDEWGNSTFHVTADLPKIAPEAEEYIRTESVRIRGYSTRIMEAFNNFPQVGKKEASTALRKIARAIEHGGKFGV